MGLHLGNFSSGNQGVKSDALSVEASPFLWALQLAKNTGIQQIIVEGDAKLVVETLLNNANDFSWVIVAKIL